MIIDHLWNINPLKVEIVLPYLQSILMPQRSVTEQDISTPLAVVQHLEELGEGSN